MAIHPRELRVILAGILLATQGVLAQAPVQVRDGQVLKDGRPYRAIGVNYFDAFYRTLKKPSDTSYDAGFKSLNDHEIPFARFMACGFWPVDMALYQKDPEAYFRLLDQVIASAQTHHVGLVPSLFWNPSTIPDLVGEPCNRWGDPNSKTIAFMRAYTAQVVERYKNSPAIWVWEFGNEYMLSADLPNAAQHRPPAHPTLGTPEKRTAEDDWTHDMIRTALSEFAKEVRRHDPLRPISSGNALPRSSAWHQWKEHSWKSDNPDQFSIMLAGDNPDPIDLLSVHAYSDNLVRVMPTGEAARTLKKPLFIGEFGLPGPVDPKSRQRFFDLLAKVEQSGAPLCALWNFDFGDNEFSVTATNERAYQLAAIAETNRKLGRASGR
jgi:hypothetical protein